MIIIDQRAERVLIHIGNIFQQYTLRVAQKKYSSLQRMIKLNDHGHTHFPIGLI